MAASLLNTASVAPAEHRGLAVGSAGMMVAGFLTTFRSPLLAVSFAKEFSFGTQYAGLPFLPRLDRRALGVSGAVLTTLCLALTGLAGSF